MPPETLQALGLKLGADVPFFLFGQSAFVQGIGEILSPLAVPEQWYVVVRPDAHVATPKIFAHPNLTRNSPPCAQPGFAQLQPFRNDMQAVVLAEYPPVAAAFRLLQDYGTPQLTASRPVGPAPAPACLSLAPHKAKPSISIAGYLKIWLPGAYVVWIGIPCKPSWEITKISGTLDNVPKKTHNSLLS